MRSSLAAASVITCQVASREPSSTSTISAKPPRPFSTRPTRCRNSGNTPSSLKQGATTDRAGRDVSLIEFTNNRCFCIPLGAHLFSGGTVMKFGIFYELQLPRPWQAGDELKLYQDALTQLETADRCGYDHAWVVE